MPVNEFERRFIEVTENHLDLKRLVRAMGQDVIPEYFGYSGSVGPFLAAGSTLETVITIQADAWFLLTYVSVGVMLPNGSTFGDSAQITDGGNCLFQLTDTGAGQELYSLPPGGVGVPAVLVAGSPIGAAAGIPWVFPLTRLIPPNTNIKASFTQLGVTALTNPLMDKAFVMLNGARIPLRSGL